jgi:G3E family GTPase
VILIDAAKYNPARIIVETSGSAFPAPIAIQIRKLSRENEGIHLDSIVTVVDCVHFRGYEVIFLFSLITGYILHSKAASQVHGRHPHE